LRRRLLHKRLIQKRLLHRRPQAAPAGEATVS
jgi:hypothetical protein